MLPFSSVEEIRKGDLKMERENVPCCCNECDNLLISSISGAISYECLEGFEIPYISGVCIYHPCVGSSLGSLAFHGCKIRRVAVHASDVG